MNIIEALESIEAAAQGNARLEALKEAHSQCESLVGILFLALSPDVTFGVKKLPEPALAPCVFKDDEQWLHATNNILIELAARKLTGNEALNAVATHMGLCNETQLKWFTRILRQDLRINIGAKDINKALGKNTIYLFEVPLATDYAKVKEKDLKGRWCLQPKLDGGRCVAIIPLDSDSPIRLLSRTGKEWGNFESIRSELEVLRREAAEAGYTGLLYLDGEVVSIVDGRIDFQSIQKTMMRKDGIEVGDLKFVVFDACFDFEWKKPLDPYTLRLEFAQNLLTKYYTGTKISVVESQVIIDPTTEKLREECAKFVERRYEGAMIRRYYHPVENKRSKSLLKVKLFSDAEAVITGVAELQRDAKGAGTLGALKCKTDEGVEFEIGTGLDDKARAELWEMRAELPGKKCSYKFFELTNDRVPRLPVYRGLRSEDDIQLKEKEDE